MRALLQRVARAEVRVDGRVVGAIGRGLLVLLGVAPDDGDATAAAMARRIVEWAESPAAASTRMAS